MLMLSGYLPYHIPCYHGNQQSSVLLDCSVIGKLAQFLYFMIHFITGDAHTQLKP